MDITICLSINPQTHLLEILTCFDLLPILPPLPISVCVDGRHLGIWQLKSDSINPSIYAGSGKSYLAKVLRDIEIENGGEAPRIHSMDDYFITEVEKVCSRLFLTHNDSTSNFF